MKVVS